MQDTYDTYPMTKPSTGEEKSILVLIGKNLDGQILQSDFDRIINEDGNALWFFFVVVKNRAFLSVCTMCNKVKITKNKHLEF